MPTINLLSQDNQSYSSDQNSARLVNMYLEIDKDNNSKYPIVALPTPGLTLFSTILSPVRALFEEHNVLYAVGGNTFYSINSSGIATTIGTLLTSTGPISICGINEAILVTDGTAGFVYDIITNTWTEEKTTASGGLVNLVTIGSVGSGYTAATVCAFIGGGGFGAAGTVNLSGGQVTSITVTNTGSGYTSAPSVSITDTGGGTGATASCTITTNAFPANTTCVTAQDEIMIAILPNSQTWQISDPTDAFTWEPLNFASTTGNNNNLVGCQTLQRQIWLFSENTTEIWYNAGLVNFPFLRRPDAYIEWGCAAVGSLVKGDNTLWFLGQSPAGGPAVVRMNGYVPQVISTPAVTYQLTKYATISDAIGFVYQQAGHLFYVLTFPTQGVTWVYDATTGMWHERNSFISSSYTRWLPSCFSQCYNKSLVGDFQSGNIYKLDLEAYTENGTSIQRLIQTHPFYEQGYNQFFDRIQLDLDTSPGSNLSQINMFVSEFTSQASFGSAIPANVQNGTYGYQVYWNRLGMSKVMFLQFQTTMNGRFCVLGAIANVRIAGPLKGSNTIQEAGQ